MQKIGIYNILVIRIFISTMLLEFRRELGAAGDGSG